MQAAATDDPHFVSKARIHELEAVSDLPQYRTMVRSIEPSDLQRHRAQIEALMQAFGKERQHFLELLSTRQYRAKCIGTSWREIRDGLVAEKYTSVSGLQARHWKMALQTSAATMSNYWRLAQTKALAKIRRKPWYAALNRLEQRYVNRLLGSLSMDFFEVLDGRIPLVVEDTASERIGSRKGLSKAVRRMVRSVQGRHPCHGDDKSVWFDVSCYTAKPCTGGVVVGLMSQTKGKRLQLFIKGTVPVKSTIRLVKKADGGIDLHVQKRMTPTAIHLEEDLKKPAESVWCRALDLGFSEVATDDAGRQFGCGLGKKLKEFAGYLDGKLKERNALYARAQSSGVKKRRRMMRCNLGEKSMRRNIERIRVQIKNIVNEALNRILKESPAQAYVLEDLSHRFRMDGDYSKKVRNMLSKWVRGTIKERLLFKTASRGIQVVFVPASYSSQHCPNCGCSTRENRSADKFRCRHCGYEAHADQNGAWNLLLRAGDAQYKRYMTKESVRALERSRYEAWCRARGEEPIAERKKQKPTK